MLRKRKIISSINSNLNYELICFNNGKKEVGVGYQISKNSSFLSACLGVIDNDRFNGDCLDLESNIHKFRFGKFIDNQFISGFTYNGDDLEITSEYSRLPLAIKMHGSNFAIIEKDSRNTYRRGIRFMDSKFEYIAIQNENEIFSRSEIRSKIILKTLDYEDQKEIYSFLCHLNVPQFLHREYFDNPLDLNKRYSSYAESYRKEDQFTSEADNITIKHDDNIFNIYENNDPNTGFGFSFKLDYNSSSIELVDETFEEIGRGTLSHNYEDNKDYYQIDCPLKNKKIILYNKPFESIILQISDNDATNCIRVDTDLSFMVEFSNGRGSSNIYPDELLGQNFIKEETHDDEEDLVQEDINQVHNQTITDQYTDQYTDQESQEVQQPCNAEKTLNEMIGLTKVKQKIERLRAVIKKNPGKRLNLNFAFLGNPGTGKTAVARLLAEIFYDNHILKQNKLIEVKREDLVAGYIGQTEEKTKKVIESAMGGVLFIDEAYTLASGGDNDFGKQALDILLTYMENCRGELCIIFAGYSKEMDKLFTTNSGFKSRIPDSNTIVFEDYNEDELRQIAQTMIAKDEFIDNITDDAMDELIRYIMRKANTPKFGNAREVRTAIEAAIEQQNFRTVDDPNDKTITIDDVRNITRDPDEVVAIKSEDKLNELIGLADVKEQIITLKNAMKKFKFLPSKTNIHFAFLGNPGSGKTEVARLIAGILFEEGILPTKNLIEADASDLIGRYVGETGPKTHALFERALGGVLFIDEAYAIANNDAFGPEAVAALLKDMEDYRGKISVILAGYNKEMKQLFDMNSGFNSRIPLANQINFKDYSLDELMEITKLMIKKEGYTITPDALNEFKKLVMLAKSEPIFENARFIRNTLQTIELIQNSRTVDSDSMEIIIDDVIKYEKKMGISDIVKEDNSSLLPDYSYIRSLPPQNGPVSTQFITERTVSINNKMTDGGEGEGTGFIISPDGYIITNNHVVDGAGKLTIGINYFLANGKQLKIYEEAKILAVDKVHDAAVIKLVEEHNDLPYLTLYDPDCDIYRMMDEVIMGGYPLGQSRFNELTITKGYIQSVNVDEHLQGEAFKRIYVDLRGTHGNSGSALIDVARCRVIGIFSGASVDRQANAELNFAIPIDYAINLIRNKK